MLVDPVSPGNKEPESKSEHSIPSQPERKVGAVRDQIEDPVAEHDHPYDQRTLGIPAEREIQSRQQHGPTERSHQREAFGAAFLAARATA